MTRTIPALALLALLTTACTPETDAAPPAAEATTTTTTKEATTGEPVTEPTSGSGQGEPGPCTSADVAAEVAPGEWPEPGTWHTAVVLTHRGPGACTLTGAAELRFVGPAGPLEIQQVMSDDGGPAGPVVVTKGEQASMVVLVPTTAEEPPPSDCLTGGGVVEVVLTDGDEPAAAEASLPPVCGAVQVTPWGEGGAPGVAPN
jgi:hypothetical protein